MILANEKIKLENKLFVREETSRTHSGIDESNPATIFGTEEAHGSGADDNEEDIVNYRKITDLSRAKGSFDELFVLLLEHHLLFLKVTRRNRALDEDSITDAVEVAYKVRSIVRLAEVYYAW